MEQLPNILEKIPQEIAKSVMAMSKTDDVAERKIHSEIIFNLSSSLGVFIGAMESTESMDFDDDCDEPFFDPPASGKKGKKSRRDDDLPF